MANSGVRGVNEVHFLKLASNAISRNSDWAVSMCCGGGNGAQLVDSARGDGSICARKSNWEEFEFVAV